MNQVTKKGESKIDFWYCLHIVGSSNGRTPDFGSGYLGSNPSPTASLR